MGGSQTIDEVDHQPGIKGAVVGAAAIFIEREFVREDEIEERPCSCWFQAMHRWCAATGACGTLLACVLQVLVEGLEDEQEFVRLFGPAFSLQTDVVF